MARNAILIFGAAGLLAACSTTGQSDSAAAGPAPARIASAELRNGAGVAVGRATASEAGDGVRVSVEAFGVAPGVHGLHVHTVGRCDAPDFASAGGHWNPTSHQHGTQNPQGPHGGDMPNLIVGTDGRGMLAINLPAGTLAGLLDGDGSAIVIHAGPDDLKTDPSGNSGGRIACGVFYPG